MRRSQLEHAIRAACSIAEIDSVIIVGSQAILGTYTESELPALATRSAEVDVLPDVDEIGVLRDLADRIEVIAGELSPFEETHGFALDGVDDTTCILASGWRDRLVVVSNDNTRDLVTGRQYSGRCLSPEDVCVAKLCAGREKDRRFVSALLDAELVSSADLRRLLYQVDGQHAQAADRALKGFFQA